MIDLWNPGAFRLAELIINNPVHLRVAGIILISSARLINLAAIMFAKLTIRMNML